MRQIIFLLVAALLGVSAKAQVEFGLKGGLNSPNIDISQFTSTEEGLNELEANRPQLGFNLGLFFKIDAAPLFVQPEFLFTNFYTNFDGVNNNGNSVSEGQFLQRLDLPIMVGKNFSNFRIMAGPIYSVQFNPENEVTREQLANGTFGYQAGIGAEVGNVQIDLRYEGAFNETAQEIIVKNTRYQTDMRISQFVLTVGYYLF